MGSGAEIRDQIRTRIQKIIAMQMLTGGIWTINRQTFQAVYSDLQKVGYLFIVPAE